MKQNKITVFRKFDKFAHFRNDFLQQNKNLSPILDDLKAYERLSLNISQKKSGLFFSGAIYLIDCFSKLLLCLR